MSRKFENADRYLHRLLWSGNTAFISATRLFTRIYRGYRGNSRRCIIAWKALLIGRFFYEDRSCSLAVYPVTTASQILWNKEKQVALFQKTPQKAAFFEVVLETSFISWYNVRDKSKGTVVKL